MFPRAKKWPFLPDRTYDSLFEKEGCGGHPYYALGTPVRREGAIAEAIAVSTHKGRRCSDKDWWSHGQMQWGVQMHWGVVLGNFGEVLTKKR